MLGMYPKNLNSLLQGAPKRVPNFWEPPRVGTCEEGIALVLHHVENFVYVHMYPAQDGKRSVGCLLQAAQQGGRDPKPQTLDPGFKARRLSDLHRPGGTAIAKGRAILVRLLGYLRVSQI